MSSKSYSTSTTKVSDNRVILEAGDALETFVSPESAYAAPGGSAINIDSGLNTTLTQNIEGLTGPDINALATSIFADSQADQTAIVDLAQAALGSVETLAASAQDAAGADWQKWLPYIVIGAVVVIYLGAK